MSSMVIDADRAGHRWAERRHMAMLLRLTVLLLPVATSVVFVAAATRFVPRPSSFARATLWWIGLTAASTGVLVAAERALRRFLPLVALFRVSLAFPDAAPSRFKVAMRTNTVRQLQRTLADGTKSGSVQGCAERLVALANALNAHDRLTRGHTERVRAYTLMIGEEMGLARAELDRLHWAGLVHDIGKLEVPREILRKAGKPTDDEWQVLRGHPGAGVEMVEPLRPWLGDWIDAAGQHHERWDGKGYPLGLAGAQISLAGRIVAVADAFDVMTSIRSYKKAMPPEEARAELARCAGTQFDPQVVRAFLNLGLGRLRVVMGPLSWLANVPLLSNAPVAAAPAATALSSLAALAIVAATGMLGSTSREPADVVAAGRVAVDAPVVVTAPVHVAGSEDQPIVIDVATANASVPTRWSIIVAPPHTVVEEQSGRVRLLPETDFNGRTEGRYEACWNERCSASSLIIDIEPVDDDPVPADDQYRMKEDGVLVVDPTQNDRDVEDGRPRLLRIDNEITLVAAGPVTGTASASVVKGQLQFRPPRDFFGTAEFRYWVTDHDGHEASAQIRVEVEPVNDPPRANADTVRATAGTTATFNVLTNDVDVDGDDLTIVSSSIVLGSGTVDTDGRSLQFTSRPSAARFAVLRYEIEDPSHERSSALVYVTLLTSVSQPVAVDDAVTVLEDSTWASIAVLTNDRDDDGPLDGHTVRVVDPPRRGSATSNGTEILYRPATDLVGPDTLRYEVCDPTGLCDTASVTISIVPVNDAPSFTNPSRLTVDEDAGPVRVPNWATNISPGPKDEAAQLVTFTVTSNSPSLFVVAPSVDAAGTLRFVTAPNANGEAVLQVRAHDDGGTGGGGIDVSNLHVVTVTVTPVNDPVVAVDDIAHIDEDDPAGVYISVLTNDVDADGDALTVVSTNTSGVVNGTLTALGGGRFHYQPDHNFNGTETFSYVVSDGHGSTATALVQLVVDPTPDAPVATDDAFVTAESTPLSRPAPGLLANDFDEDGDAIVVTTTPVAGPSHGSVLLATSGAFTYTPTSGYVGTDSFVYEVRDSTGRAASATVSITVDSGVTAGTYFLGTTYAGGSRNLASTLLPTATPEPDHGSDGFPGLTLRKSNGAEGNPLFVTQVLSWTRNVSGQPLDLNGPVSLDLWSTIPRFRPDKKAHPYVYLYDCTSLGTGCVKLAEADRHIDPYNGGTADWVDVQMALGQVTHSVAVGRQLRLQVEVAHEDIWIAASGSRPSRLSYTVANIAPVATDDSPAAILEDAAATTINVLGNDVDTNLDPATVAITVAPTRGTATANANGTVNYTPNLDANGADQFTYRVCDTGGLCDTATVYMSVTAVNDAPNFVIGSNITVEATDPPFTQVGWATAIAVGPADENAQSRTFGLVVSDPSLFSVQPAVSSSGTLTFTLSGSVTGFADVQVTLTDSGGTANGGTNTSPLRAFRITIT